MRKMRSLSIPKKIHKAGQREAIGLMQISLKTFYKNKMFFFCKISQRKILPVLLCFGEELSLPFSPGRHQALPAEPLVPTWRALDRHLALTEEEKRKKREEGKMLIVCFCLKKEREDKKLAKQKWRNTVFGAGSLIEKLQVRTYPIKLKANCSNAVSQSREKWKVRLVPLPSRPSPDLPGHFPFCSLQTTLHFFVQIVHHLPTFVFDFRRLAKTLRPRRLARLVVSSFLPEQSNTSIGVWLCFKKSVCLACFRFPSPAQCKDV